MKKTIKITAYLLERIKALGINHIFMGAGKLVDPILFEMDNYPEMVPVMTAHEGGAAFMADGYARASGREGIGIGVCMAIGGPGVANMVGAITSANIDRSAVLAIIGQIEQNKAGTGAFQDASPSGLNEIRYLQSITNLSLETTTPELVERYFDMALRTLSGTRPGPVSLNIPLDIQASEIEYDQIPKKPTFHRHRALDRDGMQTVLAALAGAERPVILAGYGVYMSKAWDALKKFAEEYDIPVATTLRAKGVFPEDHPLSLGVFGYAGTNHSTVALMDVVPKLDTDPRIVPADMILAVGSSLNHRDTMKRSKNLDSNTIFQIDLDPEALGRNFPVNQGVVGDATAAFEYLISHAPNSLRTHKDLRLTWLKEIRKTPKLFKKDYRDWPKIWEGIGLKPGQEGIHPAKAITELHQATLDKGIRDCLVLPDSGAHRAFAAHYWESYEPGTYFTAAGFGPMGWAIPAGIGAKFARPDKTTIVITGDGCMLMHGIEIQTAVQQNLEVIIVVINNAALGNVKLRADEVNNKTAQKALSYGTPYEWKKFAEAFGAKGIEINDREELRSKFHEALEHKGGPVLVDVRCTSYWRTPTRRYRDSESID